MKRKSWDAVLRWFGPRKPRSPLRLELINLRHAVEHTDRVLVRLAEDFWKSGGVCCPTCGVYGYGELKLKQERRDARIQQIEAKLARDSQHGVSPVKIDVLTKELNNLQRAIVYTDYLLDNMAKQLRESGQHDVRLEYGIPGYAVLMRRQYRRDARVKQIKSQLESVKGDQK